MLNIFVLMAQWVQRKRFKLAPSKKMFYKNILNKVSKQANP